MQKWFKKYLVFLQGISLMVGVSQVVGCDFSDDFYRPDPILPISKTGFANVSLDKIDIERYSYNVDLLHDLDKILVQADYDLQNLDYQVSKDGTAITMDADLFRNGNYQFIITNKQNSSDQIIANLTISNSKHLADNFRVTQLGAIFDYRPKSILTALMEKNLNSLGKITEIAEQLTAVDNYEYNYNEKGEVIGATLAVDDVVPQEIPTSFYGSLNLGFSASGEPVSPTGTWGIKLDQLVGELETDLATVDKNDTYSILMYLITRNLGLYNYLGVLINDLDLITVQPSVGENSKYEVTFKTKPYEWQNRPLTPKEQNAEYDNFAHYLNDSDGITITFSYFNFKKQL
ncbi:hypothetical protein SCLARK_001758 [Spiroplasma clarkii]|uniref:Uncharacterized protein n=1 Tax=Spiroplasma clarkii TaxID=2139 RepID=A0A1Y0L2H3_9MOLU|nr:hypothetical protein [Spiroplasma clarkii]ARU92211.1 hypothetical protein SCLARK_001758 [Spiroplasma clarkii]ATX71533.1 hypothetical protein SCLAR_v1c12330 [Spiroplasma clarkii]